MRVYTTKASPLTETSLKSSAVFHVSSPFLHSIHMQKEQEGTTALMVTVKNVQTAFGTNVKHFTKIDTETRLNTSGSKVACFGEVHLLQFVPL